jgi:hypothetical protein
VASNIHLIMSYLASPLVRRHRLRECDIGFSEPQPLWAGVATI